MKKSILKDKSYIFAVEIVKMSQYLQSQKREYVLSKQILRSGTAIAALIREAEFAESKADFSHKLSISLKEANETLFWLNILHDTGYIDKESFEGKQMNCRGIIAMLVSSVKTVKSNGKSGK